MKANSVGSQSAHFLGAAGWTYPIGIQPLTWLLRLERHVKADCASVRLLSRMDQMMCFTIGMTCEGAHYPGNSDAYFVVYCFKQLISPYTDPTPRFILPPFWKSWISLRFQLPNSNGNQIIGVPCTGTTLGDTLVEPPWFDDACNLLRVFSPIWRSRFRSLTFPRLSSKPNDAKILRVLTHNW